MVNLEHIDPRKSKGQYRDPETRGWLGITAMTKRVTSYARGRKLPSPYHGLPVRVKVNNEMIGPYGYE